MPTYLLNGDRLLYFAVWKQHYSIYGATAGVVAAFQNELAAYKVEKGTIRFPLSQPVSVKLIGRIVNSARERSRRALGQQWLGRIDIRERVRGYVESGVQDPLSAISSGAFSGGPLSPLEWPRKRGGFQISDMATSRQSEFQK